MRHAVAVRIAYLISWRGGGMTGPFKKMAAQAQAWTDAGHDVGLFVVTSRAAEREWRDLAQAVRIEATDRGPAAGLLARRRVYRALTQWRPDVTYLRHGIYAPGLGRLVRRFPTVLEINGDETLIATQTSRLKARWATATRSRILGRAKGAVFMSGDLARSAAFSRFGFAAVIIPNGIDLAATAQLAPTTGNAPRLALLGHPDSPWHGTDKLIALAGRHPRWGFDVIGPDAADLGGTAPANLTLHPELSTEDYLPILARADIGIGTLAMHRINVAENPALKVREYLALGLPVIVGCGDPDFPDPVEFILELPNTESNVGDHDAEIERFVESWQGRRVLRAAIANLDLGIKEHERLEFLARFARADPESAPPGPTMTS
jgi:hypothetical protein